MENKVFVSYSHESKDIADKIVEKLEQTGIKCWYAPRNIVGDYATAIVEAIENAVIFVLVLNQKSCESPHVLNEVEIAYKRIVEENEKIIILPFRISDEPLSKAMEYYIKRMHWVDASKSIGEGLDELCDKVNAILSPDSPNSKSVQKRETNEYYLSTSEEEFARLKLQQKFLHDFDGEVYQKCLENVTNANILDIGTSDGTYITEIVDTLKSVNKVVGLDYNGNAIQKARANAKSDSFIFEKVDVEDVMFESRLHEILEKNDIDKFDLINISMVILHLEFPEKVLKNLRHFLKDGGYIVIKDVDDGLKIAYPDKNGLFERCKEFSMNDKLGGYRLSARQIPYLLHKTGYQKIELLKSGINTIGMNFDQKEGFFDFVIPYIRDDYYDLFVKYPDNQNYKKAYEWFDSNMENMRDEFLEDGFYYSLGTMLFIARKN